MARWKCYRCKGLGEKPFCIVCMTVLVTSEKKTIRKSHAERVSEFEQQKIQSIKDFRENTQRKDLARMLRNMKKVGMKTTGIPSLDMKLKDLNPEIIVDDLDVIRLNMLKMGTMTCGNEEIDEKLAQKFGPPELWLESLKDILVSNMLDKTGIGWLDLKLIEVYGSREEWKLIY